MVAIAQAVLLNWDYGVSKIIKSLKDQWLWSTTESDGTDRSLLKRKYIPYSRIHLLFLNQHELVIGNTHESRMHLIDTRQPDKRTTFTFQSTLWCVSGFQQYGFKVIFGVTMSVVASIQVATLNIIELGNNGNSLNKRLILDDLKGGRTQKGMEFTFRICFIINNSYRTLSLQNDMQSASHWWTINVVRCERRSFAKKVCVLF